MFSPHAGLYSRRAMEVTAVILILAFGSERDRDKFEAVYHRCKNLMLHKAHAILRDPMLAEDAVSEAFIRIYKNLDKIDDPASPRTTAFVMTIVKNAALTLLKQNRAYAEPPEDYDTADDYDLEEHIVAKLTNERVMQVVENLGEDLRGVFILKFAYDMPHRDIASALGITENNVTVRLHRARKKLAELLAKEGYTYDA